MKWLMSLSLAMLFFCQIGLAKVLIITHSYNRPDFIEIQSKTFKHFLQDDYEFVVFSDAKDDAMDDAIRTACANWGVTYIRAPQEIHQRPYLPREPGDPLDRPNIRHANVVQYSMDILGFDHQGPVMILDSDMFMVRPMSIAKELENYDIMAVLRGTAPDINYLWPGFMIFAMDKLPNKRTLNFNCGKIKGSSVDSGGYSYYYLTNHPTLKRKTLNENYSCDLFCPDRFVPAHCIDRKTPVNQQIAKLTELGFNEIEINFLQKKPDSINFAFNNSFFHYRAGSNYDHQSILYDQQKMALINEYLSNILN